jgi:hypothetical protein
VEAKVANILAECRKTERRFEDPDFGPNEEDEFGAKSLYAGGKVWIFLKFSSL